MSAHTSTRAAAFAGAAALLLLTTVGCKEKKEAPQADLPAANLTITTAHTTSLNDQLMVPAHVEADPTKLVHIFPPLSGRIVELKVIAGQDVRKGQVVAMLQSGDVASARSDYEKAKVEADRADRAMTRGKLLLDHEVLSQAAYIELQATAGQDHAELERTRQRLHELGFNENSTSDIAPITSPISGTVIEVGAANGELQKSVDNATSGIATIANLDTVWVEGEVFERDLALLKRSEHVDVTVQAYPNEVFHGTLANVGDVFDPTTHTLRARVVLPNPGHRLKPAMFASLQIARPASAVVVVPATAVIHDGENAEVYVQGADGKFALRQVKVGGAHGDDVEILNGLQNGEKVVKTGASFLRAPAAGD
ncbi:efflux RND transporter periplasmic adaptor subunit [Terriglobus roseus]|uniref:Membrane fusion protein, cobalt-zinc-cadmium efflux system n=1 Tax=Terriglobus roseus TaxID=392734 RepID=A0A1H4IUL2_9BACT|nr:efflux RND transporter periplasmic adaptor subunit [Terriglobus roseus]SEB37749.1 membrane fusion protein, cobalt-zinc-cadmium efflux system [Terriglobus roseus]